MHPGGGSAQARANMAARFFPAEHGGKAHPTTTSPVEVIIMVAELLPEAQSRTQPEVVAFSKWKHVKTPLPEEVWNAEREPMTAEGLGEGENVEVANVFLGGIGEMHKRAVKGDPHLCELHPSCQLLAV